MRLCSIASGSSGNCIYVGSDHTHLLIDTGISKKRIEEGLKNLEIKGEELDGILLTHEHSDHIQGLGVFSRKYEIPVYATPGTIRGVREYKKLGEIPDGLFHEIDVDLGIYDEYTVSKLQNLDAILLEANHDIHMLEVGSYPYYLKQRVLGNRGHLSNELSGRLLCDILHENLKHVLLGHLSKENNYSELAYETVKMEVLLSDVPYKPGDFRMEVARRDMPSDIITV